MEKSAYQEINALRDEHWWFRGRRKIIEDKLRVYLPKNGKFSRALDIGCGPGVNLSLLQRYSDTVCGLDNSDEAIRLARRNYPDVAFIKDEFPFTSERAARYDFITLLDVLEHIKDDVAALRSVGATMEEGGIAIITVPALMMLWTAHDERLHHYRRYTKKELCERISSITTLQVDYIGYFNFLLFLPILFFRLVNKAFGLRDKTDLFLPPKSVNALLLKIFSFESELFKRIKFPIGVSILCVIKKKS